MWPYYPYLHIITGIPNPRVMDFKTLVEDFIDNDDVNLFSFAVEVEKKIF